MSQDLLFLYKFKSQKYSSFSHKRILHLHHLYLYILLLCWCEAVTLTLPRIGSPKSPSSPTVMTTSASQQTQLSATLKFLSRSIFQGNKITPPHTHTHECGLLRRDCPQWLLTKGNHARVLPSDLKVSSSFTGKKRQCSTSDRTHWQCTSSISVLSHNCGVAKGNKKKTYSIKNKCGISTL